MGTAEGQGDHAFMNDKHLQPSELPAMRSFRICLDHPQRPTTILGIVRRAAAEQAGAGQAGSRQVSRAVRLPRPTSVFA